MRRSPMLNPGFLIWRRLAVRAKRAADWERSARCYRNALKWRPRHAPSWVQYGNSLKEAGRLEAAEAAYREALALADRTPDTQLQLGHVLKLQGRGNAAAAAYGRALALDPGLSDASLELIGLGRLEHVAPPQHRVPAGGDIVFEVGDALRHLLHHARPSGIQRVQLNVVASLLRHSERRHLARIAAFVPEREGWIAVPEELFLRLAELAGAGEAGEAAWRAARGALVDALYGGARLDFAEGAALVDLGTASGLGNYFLALRDAKARHGIGYYPFVHDCIPALFPEYCTPQTVRNYGEWLPGVLLHADGVLVASQATAADLRLLAERLGHPIARPKIARLDAGVAMTSADARPRRVPYVLFVSTFEPRKNHRLAFEAWRDLIDRRGLRHVPELVCVGSRAWMVEPAMELWRGDRWLRRRVRLRHGVSDAELAALYRDCLFTLYPSAYEGWGLPVTESLCYGKVPLIAAVSALPEAGGPFAEYFALGSAPDLVAKLDRLIDDGAYRRAREDAIRQGFRPRPWHEIADEILGWALAQRPAPFRSPSAATGRPISFARRSDSRLSPGLVAGEAYRGGMGWWAPEEWGCWLKDEAAEIAFSVPGAGAGSVAIGLRGLPRGTAAFTLRLDGSEATAAGALGPGEERWVHLPLPAGARSVRLRLTAGGECDLAELTDGMDRRVVRLGVLGFQLLAEASPASACALAARPAARSP